MNLILQPCASKLAAEHYQHTILNEELDLNTIKNYLNDIDYKNLQNIYHDDPIKIWGVVRTVNSKWEKMQIGDISLFTGNKEIFAYGTICYKCHNASLAKYLWGNDEQGRSWEYIYFLTSLNSVHISYTDFNKAVGYNENYIIQGFNILNDEKTNRFLNLFPIENTIYQAEVKETEYIDIINNRFQNADDLDGKTLTNHRKEQSFLRRRLFNNKLTEKCAICGKEFPVEFLCCSHLKKRCLCSTEEKLDYKNIVLPMCQFGCDDLYEKGYIGVDNGLVTVIKFAHNQEVDSYIKNIQGNIVEKFSTDNKKYFDQHLVMHGYKSKI